MRQVVAVVGIYFASFVVAAFVTPPDPLTQVLVGVATLLIAIPCYFVGSLHGRRSRDGLHEVSLRRRMITMLVIVLATFSLAAVVSVDVGQCLLYSAGMLVIAIPSYFVGSSDGRRAAKMAHGVEGTSARKIE